MASNRTILNFQQVSGSSGQPQNFNELIISGSLIFESGSLPTYTGSGDGAEGLGFYPIFISSSKELFFASDRDWETNY